MILSWATHRAVLPCGSVPGLKAISRASRFTPPNNEPSWVTQYHLLDVGRNFRTITCWLADDPEVRRAVEEGLSPLSDIKVKIACPPASGCAVINLLNGTGHLRLR